MLPSNLSIQCFLPYHASMTEIEAFARYRERAGLPGKYGQLNDITYHFIHLDLIFLFVQEEHMIQMLLVQ